MSAIYLPFSYLMKGCLFISGGNYIWALLFFALVMQLILLPLAIKQQKSQIMMAKIKPKEMAIREKYKGRNDRVTQQKMQIEIQNMYQDENYNQFSGCLPLLIQLPIIFILFVIVRQPITYSSDILDNNPNFIEQTATEAVEYYDVLKENLQKDAFKTEKDYNEFIKELEEKQTILGGKKNDNGKFEFNKDNAKLDYAELEISSLIVDGEEKVKSLIEDGKLSGEFLAVYQQDKFNFTAKYNEKFPDFKVFGINLLNTPSLSGDYWLLIIPILVFLTSFLSTKLTRKLSGAAAQTDANGNPVGGGLFMEVGMPLISAIFTFNFSAAVGAYWIWRTLISMIQSVVLAKTMPIPKVTEEDIAAARKALKAKVKKKKVITIEVDEDDTSYDDMRVDSSRSATVSQSADPAKRTPRKIEMLTAEDESESDTNSENND